jgi:quinol monooxygenase YgiN
MLTRGLLVRLRCEPGNEAGVEAFVRTIVSSLHSGASTPAGFAVRFGRREFGIFDAFTDEESRDAYTHGPMANALAARSEGLLSEAPIVQKVTILSEKFPSNGHREGITKALLLTFKAKRGQEIALEDFLRGAKQFVDAEPATTVWFALRFEGGVYGIFDVFPDGRGRAAHLTGRVPREFVKKAFSLLGSVPRMSVLNVVAEKIAA